MDRRAPVPITLNVDKLPKNGQTVCVSNKKHGQNRVKSKTMKKKTADKWTRYTPIFIVVTIVISMAITGIVAVRVSPDAGAISGLAFGLGVMLIYLITAIVVLYRSTDKSK